MRVSASEQVQSWLTGLPPETKRKVRLALRRLAKGQGDVKALTRPLEGFNRLRIGGLRVIYRQTSRDKILLEYAHARDRVYETFQELARAMEEKLRGKADKLTN